MSKPINICGSSNLFHPKNNKFLYKLEIIFKDCSKNEFVKLTESKHLKIINFNNDIIYDKINSFYITIEDINEKHIYSYSSKLKFEENINNKIYKNNDIYIEFRKNSEGKVECNCSLTAIDNRIFITPPNY